MIGQTFMPQGQGVTERPQGPDNQAGVQQAIKILNLRMPRVAGAGAPAPQALLEGMGSAGMPQQASSPILQAIIQAVLGHFQPQQMGAPSAMGGFQQQGPSQGSMSLPQNVTPRINYHPLPGGTAGPNTVGYRSATGSERTTQGKQDVPEYQNTPF